MLVGVSQTVAALCSNSSFFCFPAGPGLSDPCEKETIDPTVSLTAQEREDLTAAAQVRRAQVECCTKFVCLFETYMMNLFPPDTLWRGKTDLMSLIGPD